MRRGSLPLAMRVVRFLISNPVLAPSSSLSSSSHHAYVGARWNRALAETWTHRWRESTQHPRSDFTQADHLPPQPNPTKRFCKLSRATFSRTSQARTGHAHIGSYYSRIVPMEATYCPCGDALQSRRHILQECETTIDSDTSWGNTMRTER